MGSQDRSPRSAWCLLGFLTLLNLVNFVDRQLILSLQVPLKADPELHLDDMHVTLLAGYAFAVVYSLAGLLLGTVADRWHRPRLIALGLLVWSAMTASSGLARSFWQLALARIFVAIGEATLTPAAIAMLGDVFRPRQRALASGLYYLGIPLGAGLSFILASYLEPIPGIGWRGCFLGLGLCGVILVAVLLFVKDPPRGGMEDSAATSPRPGTFPSMGQLLRDILVTLWRAPALSMTMLGAVLMNIAVGATYLDPSWMVRERGFTQSQATLFLGVLFLLGGSVGNLLGGWVGDWFGRRLVGGRLLALALMQAAIAPFGIAFRFVSPETIVFPICFFFAAMLATILYGPVYASVQELTPLRMRATMVAFLVIWLNLLGASLGAIMAAWLTQRFESYTWGIFATSLVGLLAIPLFLAAWRRYETDRARVYTAAAANLLGE